MKKTTSILILSALAAIATSCSSITADSTTSVNAERGVPGGEVVRTTTVDATVTAIDAAKREVSVVTRYGEKRTIEAGAGVANFDQIRIGDQLKVSYTERLLVRMAKPGENLDDRSYTTGDFAKPGAKPGATVTETNQFVATVTAIDTKRRKVTLGFSDGSSDKFDVRPDIDLSRHKVGEKVLIRSTEALAVSMKKP